MTQFNNTTTKAGIIQKIEFFSGLGDSAISGNSILLNQMTGLVNDWLGVMVGDILQCDGRYQWDDTNYSNQPIATFDLVLGQQGYSFFQDDDGNQILDVTRVEVKNAASGDWVLLKPIDQQEIREGYDEYLEGNGIPVYYDFIGTVLNVFPAPSYSSSAGAKVFFKREPNYFASDQTSNEPGIATPFQKILWLGPAYDYLLAQGRPNDRLRQEVEAERERLREFYSRRNKYEQPRISGRVVSSR